MTRCSPESCWDRFTIEAEQTVELKWLVFKKKNTTNDSTHHA